MKLSPLPQPVTNTDWWLAAVVDRLDQLNTAVSELNGRLTPATQPPPDQDEQEKTVRLLEPDRPPEPPRRGKGSSRDEWAAYADQLGVIYVPGAGQRAIIAAVEAARRAA